MAQNASRQKKRIRRIAGKGVLVNGFLNCIKQKIYLIVYLETNGLWKYVSATAFTERALIWALGCNVSYFCLDLLVGGANAAWPLQLLDGLFQLLNLLRYFL